MASHLHDTLSFIEGYVALYGALALFVIIALESLGVPVPGESALIAASLLALRGDLAISHVFLAAFLGALLGDSVGYLIGHRYGTAVLDRFGQKLGLTPERRARIESQFESRGIYVVASARFVVILRQLNGLLAGSSRMPYRLFLMADIVGCAAWASVWGFGPYFFGDLFKSLHL